jgi:hypothetical protein
MGTLEEAEWNALLEKTIWDYISEPIHAPKTRIIQPLTTVAAKIMDGQCFLIYKLFSQPSPTTVFKTLQIQAVLLHQCPHHPLLGNNYFLARHSLFLSMEPERYPSFWFPSQGASFSGICNWHPRRHRHGSGPLGAGDINLALTSS